MISVDIRAFVAVLVMFTAVEIHGRNVGMSIKQIKQHVYNALKQDNLKMFDKHATTTGSDENSVEQSTSRSIFPVLDMNKPSNEKKIRLTNKLSQTVAVKDKEVEGSIEINTEDTLLEIQSVGTGPAVMLKGHQAGQYICMEKKGRGMVYASEIKSLECVFIESMASMVAGPGRIQYHAFLHREDKSKWYFGIDDEGIALDGEEGKNTEFIDKNDEIKGATEFVKKDEIEDFGGYGSRGRY